MAKIPQQLRSIWTDAYNFYAQFHGEINTREDWEKCANTMVKISQAHNDHPLAKSILIAVYDQLNREATDG